MASLRISGFSRSRSPTLSTSWKEPVVMLFAVSGRADANTENATATLTILPRYGNDILFTMSTNPRG